MNAQPDHPLSRNDSVELGLKVESAPAGQASSLSRVTERKPYHLVLPKSDACFGGSIVSSRVRDRQDACPTESFQPSRRGFFITAARSGALLVLAVFAGWQEAKRRRLANDPNCILMTTCSACAEFGRCQKPKAVETRSLPVEVRTIE